MGGKNNNTRYRWHGKTVSLILSAALLATSFTGLGSIAGSAEAAEESSPVDYGLMDTCQKGTILHCFDWKYSDIKAELENIAKAGFTSVQTSPAQHGGGPSTETGTWWWLYQPLDFTIGSDYLGTKDELQELCDEADKYGIKIIVDVVANHLAADHTNINEELKDDKYWRTSSEWTNVSTRLKTVYKPIVGDYDIKSENQTVQNMVKDYVQELKSVGVDGIRWDAVKHIQVPSDDGCDFFDAVIDSTMYNYGESLGDPGAGDDTKNQKLMQEYAGYMSITDDVYGNNLRNSLKSGTLPSTIGNWSYRGMSADKLVYWGESHDTYANLPSEQGSNYSATLDQNIIDRVYAIVASRKDATALYFSRPPKINKDDIHAGVKGSTHFTSAEVAAINHFHNAMYGQAEYCFNQSGFSAVCREQGAVIVAASGANKSVSITNGGSLLTPGTYTDEISGNKFTVTSSTITGTIGSTGIAAIYEDAVFDGSIFAEKATNTAFVDTMEVKLRAINVTNAAYTTSEGASGSFINGQTITVGSSIDVGEYVIVTLTGEKSDGTSLTQTYKYRKKSASESVIAYFDNLKYNWSSVYAYVYRSDTDKMSKWPGTQMTLDSTTGYYAIDVSAFADGKIIFSQNGDSTNRYPGENAPGMDIDGQNMVFGENHSWTIYEMPAESVSVKVYFDNSSYKWNTINAYVYKKGGRNNGWPGIAMTKVSENLYEYKVPAEFSDGYVIFNNKSGNGNYIKYPSKDGYSINNKSMIFGAGQSWTEYTPVVAEGSVSASVADGTTFTDTFEVKLYAQNVDSATYKINDGAETSYTNGATITLSDTATVTLKGVQSDGTTVTATYTYTKEQETDTVKVYFDNSAYNWSTVNAYFYNGENNNTWPGTAMTLVSGNIYKIDMTDELVNYTNGGKIIFNNGSGSQYPAKDGLEINGSSMIFDVNKGWSAIGSVSAYSKYGSGFDDILSLTLFAEDGITDTKYQFNNVWVNYTSGETVTIPVSDLSVGDTVTITLSGTKDGEAVTQTYNYEKGVKLYFDNSVRKWSHVYAYIFDGGRNEMGWTDLPMIYNSNIGLYECIVTGLITGDVRVIFNNGGQYAGNQYPLSGTVIKLKIEGQSHKLNSNDVWNVYPQDISEGVITLSESELDYTGTAQTVTATVTVGETTLTQGTDYTIEGDTSGTNAGTYIVKAIGKGGYKGTLKATWKIKQSYTVTVDMNGATTTYDNLTNGQSFSVKADKVDGKTFSCWKVGEKVVSTSEAYSFIVLGDTTLTAVYGQTVEAQPILNMSAVQATYNGKNAVKFIFTHSVPSGYTVKEVGIRYGTNKLAGADTSKEGYATVDLVERGSEYGVSNVESVVKNKSFKIKQYVANYKCLNGTVQFSYAVGENTTAYVYAVGYMKLVKDGVEQIVYSDFIHTSYNGITG